MEFHIGKLIRSIREEREIQQSRVSRGLCGRSAMSKIELGELEPGKWMADVMLERLGVSSNKFGCLFSGEEMKEYEIRWILLQLLRQGDPEELRQCWKDAWLEVKQAERNKRKGTVYQRQFLQYVRLIACYGTREAETLEVEKLTLEEREQEIRDTLKLTIPDFSVRRLEQYLLGRMERALVVLLADVLAQQPEKQEEGLQLYRRVLNLLERQVIDPEELRYQYPRIASLAVQRLASLGCYSESWISEKAYKILQESRKISEIIPLLRYEQKCSNRSLTDAEMEEIEEGLQALEQLMKEVGESEPDAEKNPAAENVCHSEETGRLRAWIELAESNFRGIALGERVSKIRRERGITQAELGEDICDPKTVLRLEKGNVKPSPYVYRSLLARLGQEEYRYFPFIISDDYELHECRRKIEAYIAAQEYEQAEKELVHLECMLEKGEKINHQILLRFRALVDGKFQRIKLEEELKKLKEALNLTVPDDIDLKCWPLKQMEVMILNNIGNTEEELGEIETAKNMIMSVKIACESNQVGVEQNATQYLLTLCNLIRYQGKLGRYKEALEIVKTGLKLGIGMEDGEAVVDFLYEKVWLIEKQYEDSNKKLEEKAKACLPICKQAFLIAKLIRYSYYEKFIAKHCAKEYDIIF